MTATPGPLIFLAGAFFIATMSCSSVGVLNSVSSLTPGAGPARDHREPGRSGSVWVVNRDRGELVVFDAETGKLLTTLQVGSGAHDICISEQAGKAYIAAETIDRVTTVDTRTLAMQWIAVGPRPHHVEPSPDGRTVYVSLASHTSTLGSPQYAAISTDDNSIIFRMTSTNPSARSHAPYPSLTGETVHVAHDLGDQVSGIDAVTGNIDFSIAPILRAEEVIPTRLGNHLWVSSRGDGTVKRIDLDTNRATASVAVGDQPESVMLTPNDLTLVTSLRGSPASLAFVDTTNLSLLGRIQIGGAGTFGDLAVITGDGRYVYATFDAGVDGTGGVAVVDVQKRKVEATWAYPGIGRPHGIWYSQTRARF